MNALLADILCSLSMAFGMTAMTAFSSRTETDKPLMGLTFGSGVILVFCLLRFADLPEGTAVWLGIVGLLMGLVSSLGLYIARMIERGPSTR
jgi:drug/metabolite transporter (DMT)-like permease